MTNKKYAILILWGCCCPLQSVFAEEINSRVIHNYSQVSAGYGYLHDIANTGVNAHGGIAGASYEVENFIFGVNGGYFVGDGAFDSDLWSINAGVGYVIRLASNRVNIIPAFGVGYGEVTETYPDGSSNHGDSTTINPGITASYALNNRWSISSGYNYGRDVDSGFDTHGLSVGTRVALAERIGFNLGAVFIEKAGFAGLTAALSYHF